MEYKTAAALEMAVKEAAKASPLDTNRAISGFYRHRLLCRVFAGRNESFVLKGGQGVLARTIDARATRDIDLLSRQNSVEDALANLINLAQMDLGDFVTFEFLNALPIMTEDEYRSGLCVEFTVTLGAKRIGTISIDLVVDEIPLEDAEFIAPADRIYVRGIPVCDYLVYPVENALADKFCAISETHGNRPSSRVKDLVDIVIYALTSNVDGRKLQKYIRKESAARKLVLPSTFSVPDEWVKEYPQVFSKLYDQTGFSREFDSIKLAANLAKKLLDPCLVEKETEGTWDHSELSWKNKVG